MDTAADGVVRSFFYTHCLGGLYSAIAETKDMQLCFKDENEIALKKREENTKRQTGDSFPEDKCISL